MNPNKVQSLVDEVVAQRLQKALHQRHAEAVDSGPAGGVLRLAGEALHTEDRVSGAELEHTDRATRVIAQGYSHLMPL